MQLDDLARRAPGEARRGNALELDEALIEQDDVALRVEHAEALDHVVEGGVELQLLLPQQSFGLVLRPQQPLPLRHVLMGGHPPAVGQRLIYDADEASVGRIGDELAARPWRDRATGRRDSARRRRRRFRSAGGGR